MAKDSSFYFSHDYNARNDEKVKKLLRVHGMVGYGVFWAIIEDLYNNANAMQLDCDGIAFDLRVDKEVVKSVIFDFELFEIKDIIFASSSVQRRLNERNNKSVKARESAFKRWNKYDIDANALHSECEPNAIKERKGNKGKEIKEKKENKEKVDFLEKVRGEIFSDAEDALRMSDGSWMKLTKDQKNLIKQRILKPYEILKNE